MIQVGVVGGAGYTAGELIRLLHSHTKVQLSFVYSTSYAGNQISEVHQDLIGDLDKKFVSKIDKEVDVVFLCLGHGKSKTFLKEHIFSETTKIIDLSNDFRLEKEKLFKEKSFIYGLPELSVKAIGKANYIANPGCFATAIQLAILPLAINKLLKDDLHINAVTGATGAGTSLSKTTHFAWRDNNFSYYKPFTHQHLGEIEQTIGKLQGDFEGEIMFIPNRGNFSRGIFTSLYTSFDGTIEEAISIYKAFYKEAPFTFISDKEIHLKQVVNTNKCLLYLQKYKNKLLISSAIDNLLKGASGQAIQNMNLLFGFEETEGLQLKANFF
ncbi:N-acetyl-gamma-glutamyl-phosphate reductase [Tenacibaculum maritimum]|uniref:N-acetyl-gamma-glutamyl-phosphate reductase n=1 Tax=Tenacibaculum maritimum TaxID=107401 RepID=UPI0012E639D4|nr:N-acetyl-gamma-glutamyl-phosphate reductase [Tenacibaculum maritimum]MCD9563162.1 N-acetyl-gamma-glutamyl-phosphate reductase [Tenacibaculum maritimum]MCD9566467.1 N-acetyl-gamma-glutamyl-phosphate reductase [Tenacibaculum maritimum]MCD9579800.1 N-acetyl-gamma-glutamyl-phosphate reductase [Tenacibaculum maritimum]MCD9597242.1 N-acetyl-gamma-glutamyl-phosphate reductase [Tenacibaculum maritimum]MCD9614358.1 N-acetyl-gamma-glutamyl-phosphate reductase [Tenacibaculum maritimum]